MAGAHAHRAPRRPLFSRFAPHGGAAAAITGAVVAVGTITASTSVSAAPPLDGEALVAHTVEASLAATREATVSRSAPRVALVPETVQTLVAVGDLPVYSKGKGEATEDVSVPDGSEVKLTGRTSADRSEAVVNGVVGFVETDLLAPAPAVSGISSAPCPDGSAIEKGLQPKAIKLYRAVCAAFPQLKVYGGRDPHGEHVNGEAIDFMTYTDVALGNAVAKFIDDHHEELGIYNIIYRQRYMASDDGWVWKKMADRGSPTANHMDHVHSKVL